MTSFRYIPEGAKRVQDKHSTAIVYIYQRAGNLCGIGYGGKASKPDFRYRFRNQAECERTVKEHFGKWQNIEASRLARRAERTADLHAGHTFKIGDIFVASWGYDQTNVDFYQVVGVAGKTMVDLRHICADLVSENGFMSGTVMPRRGEFNGEVTRHRVAFGRINVDNVRSAHPWDGTPMYKSWYA